MEATTKTYRRTFLLSEAETQRPSRCMVRTIYPADIPLAKAEQAAFGWSTAISQSLASYGLHELTIYYLTVYIPCLMAQRLILMARWTIVLTTNSWST